MGPAAAPAPAAVAPTPQAAPAAAAPEAASPEALARAADRAKAKEELAPLFDVIGDDFEGDRAPNQISAAEYAKVCDQYSDIRTGNSQIKIDGGDREGDALEGFRAFILGDLESMLQTATGRSLIEGLATAKDAGGEALTTTIGGAPSPGRAKASSARGTAQDVEWMHNGVGTDMAVQYAPGQEVSRPGAINPWFPLRSDVALLHELTHALHGTRGQMVRGDVSLEDAAPGDEPLPGSNTVPLEEYATVGLGPFSNGKDPRYAVNENAYRAERRALADTPFARRGDDAWAMERRTNYLVTTPQDQQHDAEELLKLQRGRP